MRAKGFEPLTGTLRGFSEHVSVCPSTTPSMGGGSTLDSVIESDLTTGVLAICAAVVAFLGVHRQIRSNERINEANRHDVRHTAATMMLDSGNTVSATAKWLGHDLGMTLRVYGHVYDDALESAGASLLGPRAASE